VDEEAAIPESDPAFGQVSIGAYKLATMLKVSEELLNDSVFDLESYIAKEFGRRMGSKEEEAFLIGDGVGKPVGVFQTTGGGEVGVTAASDKAVTADELIDLFYSLRAPYRKNAVFIMNDATVKLIRKLKDTTGQYLWQPALDGRYAGYHPQSSGLYVKLCALSGSGSSCDCFRRLLLLLDCRSSRQVFPKIKRAFCRDGSSRL